MGSTRTQVLAHGPGRDSDSELDEQFVGDSLLSPGWILPPKSLDDLAQVRRQRGATTSSRLPSPEKPKRVAVPPEKRCRLDGHQSAAPNKKSGQSNHC